MASLSLSSPTLFRRAPVGLSTTGTPQPRRVAQPARALRVKAGRKQRLTDRAGGDFAGQRLRSPPPRAADPALRLPTQRPTVPRPATGRPKETQPPRTESRPVPSLPPPHLTRRPGLAWPRSAPHGTGRGPRPLPAPFECAGPTGIGSREDLRQKGAAPSAGAPAGSRAPLPGAPRGPAGPRAVPVGGASFPPG